MSSKLGTEGVILAFFFPNISPVLFAALLTVSIALFLYSRKKGPEFVVEFYKVLPRALRHFLSKADEKSKSSVNKVVKVWEERRVFGSTKTQTLQELIEEADPTGGSILGGSASKSNKRPRSAAGIEIGGSTAVPASITAAAECVTAAEAAAARSAEFAARAASIQIPEDAHLLPEEAAATRQTLVDYQVALEEEVSKRHAARAALQSAAEAQSAASLQLTDMLNLCENKLNALSKLQASAPSALSPEPVAGPGGVEATVDAAEAAALAAQLMQNPQALLDAIAATMPQAGSQQGHVGGGVIGGEAGGAVAAAPVDEYDPENW
jgi:CID domain